MFLKRNNKELNSNNFKEQLKEFFSLRTLIELLSFVILGWFLNGYVVAYSNIKGHSMESSYHDGGFVIANKLVNLEKLIGIDISKEFNRGDVITSYPLGKENKNYLKRIIGLPGETLKITNGKVYLKGEDGKFNELQEPWLDSNSNGHTYSTVVYDKEYEKVYKENVYEIPEDSFFILGDNRQGSSDSRTCFNTCEFGGSHFVNKDSLDGKVLFGY